MSIGLLTWRQQHTSSGMPFSLSLLNDYTPRWWIAVLPAFFFFTKTFPLWTDCLECFFFLPIRLVEPSFPLLQLVPGLPHALRLLLHRVRGICRVKKGQRHLLNTVTQPIVGRGSVVDQWFLAAGGDGAGVRGGGAAAAARTARVWHRVGGIGATARQPG